jgi:hypothetical protein
MIRKLFNLPCVDYHRAGKFDPFYMNYTLEVPVMELSAMLRLILDVFSSDLLMRQVI